MYPSLALFEYSQCNKFTWTTIFIGLIELYLLKALHLL